MNAVRAALERFDGTHTAELVGAMDMARADVAGLVALCFDPDVAVAATWLVKALVEQGTDVTLDHVFASLQAQTEWAAQLHILQCVQFAPMAAVAHVDAVRDLMGADKALVRVWALDAFVRIAQCAPKFRKDAKGFVEAALAAKAASLRARARNLKVVCAGW
ncbi:hypothetical protein [Amylibacter sp. IMCC11727]|uniref:hypothetical protein n=1 Tax=Amylibacter sp. IMCC11727 TaxID=3039851 RepID=UPI00244DC815|nr:hypothetical protein [Amylibacter sp. IMCC11727]WGI22560.1 hypothetical protein QBD29_03825 [Amylibacter sp. IMCC11727]